MKSIGILICYFATALFAGAASKEPDQPDPLAVRIVPMRFQEDGGRTVTLWKPEQHFHVTVTNRSDKPLRLWREWCSWGYYNLSFVVTDEDGKIRVVKKAPRGWKKNIPDPTTIPAGNHLVYEVSFDPATWPDGPLPPEGKSRVVKLKAVFEIIADDETVKNTVWTGKVESPEHHYTIYR